MCWASPSVAPRVWATVSTTSAGSRRSASGTQKAPALKRGTSSAAASIASRVLPVPPGPVSVSKRAPSPTSVAISVTSRSRPTNELAGRGRLVLETVLSGPKLALAELVERHRPVEVLQPVLAELDEAVGLDQGRGRRGHDHLAAVPDSGDPGRPVDVRAHVPLLGDERRAGVQAYANANRAARERRGRLLGRLERTLCRAEGNEEGVALRVYLHATLGRKRLAQRATVLGERLRIALRTEFVQEPGRALDVGEEEGDGPGREVTHGSSEANCEGRRQPERAEPIPWRALSTS
jgi:hypothetical protein